jgi:hypothetical protein
LAAAAALAAAVVGSAVVNVLAGAYALILPLVCEPSWAL